MSDDLFGSIPDDALFEELDSNSSKRQKFTAPSSTPPTYTLFTVLTGDHMVITGCVCTSPNYRPNTAQLIIRECRATGQLPNIPHLACEPYTMINYLLTENTLDIPRDVDVMTETARRQFGYDVVHKLDPTR